MGEILNMKIKISRDSSMSLHLQIYNQIRELIYLEYLPYNTTLPSERKLSELLGVDRSTVTKAYDKLKAEGLIKSHVGKGTVVKFISDYRKSAIKVVNIFDWDGFFRENNDIKYDDIIHLIMDANSNDDKIFFAGGLPSVDLFPVEDFDAIREEVFKRNLVDLFSHSPVLGVGELRYQIKDMMERYGINSSIDEIMITSGSQQGLDLIIRSFIKRGDVVLIEEPSFFGAIQLFEHIGAKIISVPMDSEGINMDVLEFLIERHSPKLIYTIPNFHNPTGTTMSLKRRSKLIELSNQYCIPIIEDDPYGMIRYGDKKMPSLKSLDYSNHVIYLSTFSKTISVGLRIGWICASKEVIKHLKNIKQITDLHVNTINQYFVSYLIKNNIYEKHIENINTGYKEKRDLMVDKLRRNFKDGDIEFIVPDGGFYIWIYFKREMDMNLFFNMAYKNKVVFTPGKYFLPKGELYSQYIRLNFTFPNIEQINRGINILSKSYYKIIDKGVN